MRPDIRGPERPHERECGSGNGRSLHRVSSAGLGPWNGQKIQSAHTTPAMTAVREPATR